MVSTPACTVQGNCIEYKNQLSVACYKGLNLINNHWNWSNESLYRVCKIVLHNTNHILPEKIAKFGDVPHSCRCIYRTQRKMKNSPYLESQKNACTWCYPTLLHLSLYHKWRQKLDRFRTDQPIVTYRRMSGGTILDCCIKLTQL